MEANQTCQSFTPCGSADTCWGKDPALTSECWTIVWAMVALGIVSLLVSEFLLPRIPRRLLSTDQRLYVAAVSKRELSKTLTERMMHNTFHDGRNFVSYVRSEENFARDNMDPMLEIPPAYSAEYVPADIARTSLVGLLFKDWWGADWWSFIVADGGSLLLSALGWGLTMSGIGTLYWLVLYQDESCLAHNTDEVHDENAYLSRALYTAYVFFPVSVLLRYLGFQQHCM